MSLVVLAPLRLEALALRRGLCDPGSSVVRTGMGPARAKAAAERLATDRYRGPFAVAGVCGGVDPALRPGDVVVASALRTVDGGEHELAGAEVLANAVRKLGLTCVTGTILSVERLERTARRAASGHAGIVGVDMESAWLAAAAGDGPLTVLRVVADAGGRSVYSPRTLLDGALALRALRRAAPALEEWARASGPRPGVRNRYGRDASSREAGRHGANNRLLASAAVPRRQHCRDHGVRPPTRSGPPGRASN